MRKSYSGNAVPTTLSSGCAPTDLALSVGSTTGWPDTAVGPFVITIDRGQGTLEEKVLISSYSGGTLTVETRGFDGTSPQSHSSGATVVHTLDADSINTHDEVVAGVGTLTPSISAIGDAASDGTAFTAPAAGDHKHGRESFVTGVTSSSAPGDLEVDGSNASPARADHKHARESIASLVADVSPTILGLPLALTGATASTRFAGGTSSGPPVSGTFVIGDFDVDQSGVIWICTAGGSPGTWAVANAVAARVTLAASHAALLTANTWVKIPFDTKDYDTSTGSTMWDATDKRMAITVPGVYSAKARIQTAVQNNPQQSIIGLYKNGSLVQQGDLDTIRGGTAGDQFSLSFADDVKCVASDYLEIWGFNLGSNTQDVIVVNAGTDNYFSVKGPG